MLLALLQMYAVISKSHHSPDIGPMSYNIPVGAQIHRGVGICIYLNSSSHIVAHRTPGLLVSYWPLCVSP